MKLLCSIKRLLTTWLKAVTVTAIMLCSAFVIYEQAFSQPKSPSGGVDLFVEIKHLSKEAKRTGSAADYDKVGKALARTLRVSSSAEESLGRLLSDEQMAFERGRKGGVNEEKLVRTLNTFLGLDDGPEYLKLHRSELRRIRTRVWTRLPDITTGIAKSEAKRGKYLFTSTLSPFEAYTTAGLLIYQKLYDDEYVLTDAERASHRTLKERRAPGLSVLAPNSRRTEFENRLRETAKKISSLDGTFRDLLEASAND